MNNSLTQTVHFATQTDSNFLLPVLVMATSAKENMLPTSHYHFHLFYDCLAPWQIQAAKKLESTNFKISLYEVKDGRHKNYTVKNRIPTVSLTRLELPERLNQLDRVLYVDGDIIVQHDLTELYNVDMGDMLLAGVRAPLPLYKEGYQERFPGSVYINSGVMLMNLNQMRKEDLVSKFFAVKSAPLPFWKYQDQDTVNYCCANRIIALHPKYNGMNRIFQDRMKAKLDAFNKYYGTQYSCFEELESEFVLVHMAGNPGERPWKMSNVMCTEAWNYYFLRSPMKHATLNLKTPWKRLDQLEITIEEMKGSQTQTLSITKPTDSVERYGFNRFMPVVTIRTHRNPSTGRIKKHIKLFGCIPLISAKGVENKLHWRLFYFLPIWVYRKSDAN